MCVCKQAHPCMLETCRIIHRTFPFASSDLASLQTPHRIIFLAPSLTHSPVCVCILFSLPLSVRLTRVYVCMCAHNKQKHTCNTPFRCFSSSFLLDSSSLLVFSAFQSIPMEPASTRRAIESKPSEEALLFHRGALILRTHARPDGREHTKKHTFFTLLL